MQRENPMMKSAFLALSVLAACTMPLSQAETPPAEVRVEPVQVMVLGTYHFGNPGMDLVNTDADDVLAPHRQAQLEDLAERLIAFRPTAIAVERVRRTDDALDPNFADFVPEDLTQKRDERVQIGYRIAHKTGIDRVYAVDTQEGEIAYFPFDRVEAFAARTGREDKIASLIDTIKTQAEVLMQDQVSTPIAELLARQNDPAVIRSMHADFYYGLLDMSDIEDAAGAVLNYGWYARNAEIFANIAEIAEPGDRILVVYGSGHNYWLRHFAQETPGFELVEAAPYLTD
jgi:uncharacterized protein DUF5694